MKKSAILRPVSQKAYDRFVKRIYLVVTNKTKREAMLAALDSYLDGNRDTYDRNLTPDCVMVFGMLRFEIELAMIRSAKARTRARRKQTEPENQATDNATSPAADNKPTKKTVNKTEPQSAEDDTTEITPRVSRRMCRAVDRMIRSKTKWRFSR